MSLDLLFGVLTAIVCAIFASLVLQRYFARGGTHLLWWGLGLGLYFIGGATETVLAFGWSDFAFRMWYWSGALMVAAVLGQGTLHLLVRKPYVATITDIVIGIVAVASLIWMFSVPLDATQFNPSGNIGTFLTDSYKNILPSSAIRRVLPPVLNSYGTLLLTGGAIYSALLFFRKQIMPNRVLGNVLIALGSLLPAAGGALVKLAENTPALGATASTLKYIGIFLGAVVLFAGFQVTLARPAPKPSLVVSET
jgi:hypothetical protein